MLWKVMVACRSVTLAKKERPKMKPTTQEILEVKQILADLMDAVFRISEEKVWITARNGWKYFFCYQNGSGWVSPLCHKSEGSIDSLVDRDNGALEARVILELLREAKIVRA